MARNKDVPQVWQRYDADGGGYRRLRDMTASELAERDEAQQGYEQMLARQQAYEEQLATTRVESQPTPVGCVFTKSCKLPDAIIDYVTPTGFIPTDSVANYGALTLLGGREVEAGGGVALKRISGALPANLGTLTLGGVSAAAGTTGSGLGLISSGVAAGALLGLVALLAPSSLGDGALYSEEQLRNLKQARTRLRLRVEQQADGSLKGYGFNTQGRREWEMIPVAQFEARGEQQVADLGDGITLTWTPAVDPSSTIGIPPLEAAPQTPPIWIFPPTEAAERIIVSPIYPPEYRDLILVFPPGSGVQPLYIVLSTPVSGYVLAPSALPGFPDAIRAKRKTSVQGSGGRRKRWKTAKGLILEWDSQHGAVEMYDKRGRHLGEFDPLTGEQTKAADRTRSIEP
ncbi:colicin E3/pyocin S6 family cytotoxin [Pseudomonas chlororaphis]|uniref:colicin E3/pyocin S6 family cytotoxin n=1 Tax=Pseudomonas chlororaphis TaxID=587753 RepID=UPI0013898D60|nr:colicin E3/pyocin S6 family cytotoxin [Pseudomonas chlororaphis]QQX59241.1 S-type pyocin domain-containing protein [Pseudomonas chlororaphis subsp. aurantiaca]UVE45992.1 S-type pyocin domain-containing protein [Pseudomonas chlororaphis]